MRTEGQTDRHDEAVALRNFEKAPKNVQTHSGAHLTSYSASTGRFFLCSKAQRAWNWHPHLTPQREQWHRFTFYLLTRKPFNIWTGYPSVLSRSQWSRGLRHRSKAARPLRLWVRIPPGAWMFVCCECCVLSGRGLCDGLITRPEESYRLWRVIVCDQETSNTRRLNPPTGLWKYKHNGL